MKKKLKTFIPCEVFKVEPMFLVNYSPEEYRKEISKLVELKEYELDDLDFAEGQQSTFSPTKDKRIAILRVVWLRNFNPSNPEDVGCLVHEICHLVNRIHQHKGIPFNGEYNNDETFSYMVDFFTREFLINYKKK